MRGGRRARDGGRFPYGLLARSAACHDRGGGYRKDNRMSMRQTEASTWHVVGGWNHVQPGAACRVELPGAEIALWRTEAGAVHAWDNRCPHRGMRLSFGIVKGDRLACRYHGWHYDEGGQCRFIPAHPNLDPPDTLAVAQHATREQDEAIWVALGAGPTEPPPPLGTDQPRFCRSIPVTLRGRHGRRCPRASRRGFACGASADAGAARDRRGEPDGNPGRAADRRDTRRNACLP